ncbi:hypothetical protein [Yinghuangia aomiensis]
MALESDLEAGDGTFDQALSNALAAVVASEWPGEEHDRKGRVRSAAQLLDVIEERIPPVGGVCVIPEPEEDRVRGEAHHAMFGDGPYEPWDVRIDAAVLRDGIARTQAVRHARGPGGLERRHVDALFALDEHRSLRCLDSERGDRHWAGAREEDRRSQALALAVLEQIGDEEAARRSANVNQYEGYHPKHSPEGYDFQECPVCGYETLQVTAIDDYGVGIGRGRCIVCTYERNGTVVDDLASAWMFENRWADD